VIAEGGVSVSHTGVLHCRGSLGVGWQDMGFMGHPVNVQPGDRRGKHNSTCNQRSCVVACTKGVVCHHHTSGEQRIMTAAGGSRTGHGHAPSKSNWCTRW
jgi:hypothetical protein